MERIDINCDLGEGKSIADYARDAHIMPFISRCNIACGGHAGNADTMRTSVANAQKNNLLIGAHPGYPDPENFGRVSLKMDMETLLESVGNQIEKLQKIAGENGASLGHIKLHGALYNDAESDAELAQNLAEFFAKEFSHLKIMGLANAEMKSAAQKAGLSFIREGFMDRRYLNDHQLAPRSLEDSVITDLQQCQEQALSLVCGLPFHSHSGDALQFSVDSLCLHGDNPKAPKIARALLQFLQGKGIQVRP